MLNRIAGVALGLALLNWIGPWIVVIEPDAGRAVAVFHTAFNLVLAAVVTHFEIRGDTLQLPFSAPITLPPV